jgi:hypothetical protein
VSVLLHICSEACWGVGFVEGAVCSVLALMCQLLLLPGCAQSLYSETAGVHASGWQVIPLACTFQLHVLNCHK